MLNRLKNIGRKLKQELAFYKSILKDNRTPKIAKWLLAIAIGYAVMTFDLIPDFIPVIGQLDDLIIIPILIIIAFKIIPKQVIADCRKKQENIKN
jgi:uncharacterized membrane protein YkvA (DUF1232 family)